MMAVTGSNKAELSKKLTQQNIRLILAAPQEYLRDVGTAAITFWFPESTPMTNFGSRKVNRQLRTKLEMMMPINWQNLFIVILAVVYVLYTFAISILVEVGSARYRAPVDLLIFFFAFAFSFRALVATNVGEFQIPLDDAHLQKLTT